MLPRLQQAGWLAGTKGRACPLMLAQRTAHAVDGMFCTYQRSDRMGWGEMGRGAWRFALDWAARLQHITFLGMQKCNFLKFMFLLPHTGCEHSLTLQGQGSLHWGCGDRMLCHIPKYNFSDSVSISGYSPTLKIRYEKYVPYPIGSCPLFNLFPISFLFLFSFNFRFFNICIIIYAS